MPKTRKKKRVDCRHAGMDFYCDLDAYFKMQYEEKWNSGNSEYFKIAFYEPDFKKLDNLLQQIHQFDKPIDVP